MRGGKASHRWGLGVLGLAAALTAVAHAATGDLTVPGGSTNTGSAKCAKGKIATAGGFSGEPAVTWEILGFRPVGRRWSVRLFNGEGDQQEATLHAICKGSERFSTRKVRREIEDGESSSVVVKCPRGSSVAGGGFAPIPGAMPNVTENRPVGDRKWRVTVYVNEPGVPTHVYRVRAVCDRAGGEYVTRTDFTEPDPPRQLRGTSVAFAVEANCTAGSRLTGGGFSSGEELNERYEVIRPRRRSFRVQGRSFSSVPITAYARCLK